MTRPVGAIEVFPPPAYSPSLLSALLLPGQPGFSIQGPGTGQTRRPCVTVVTTATQAITTATNTILNIPVPVSDPWSLRTSTTQLTVPKGYAGFWLVSANIAWPAATDATRRLGAIAINGAGLLGTTTGPALAVAGQGTNSVPSILLNLAGGDLITIIARHDSATTPLTIAIGGFTLTAAFISPA